MCAARTIRAQRDRLLRCQPLLKDASGDAVADYARAPRLEKLVSDLVHASDSDSLGLEAGSRYLATCLEMAAQSGARLDLNDALPVMPDEQVYHALLAQSFPAPPATQTEAFSRIEAAYHAVKLSQEHHLPLCIHAIDHLARIARAAPHHAPRRHRRGRKAAHSDATGEPQMEEEAIGSMDEARTHLDCACTLASLAVEHIDHAVTAISAFIDPKEVAGIAKMAKKVAIVN
ncbi:hypothetical protein CFC21_013515 [Triticum aestivum]|uniref:Uncharacterized protein n=2 Tax=Triticum aestivum TaxID=4565 RepID=A0A9R1DS92_WHEAT|nr:hypothetical protein CFC21_013515 [Triticum aestivum]